MTDNIYVLFVYTQHFQHFRYNQRVNILFFGKMSAIVKGKSVSKVLFPCSDAHYPTITIVIMSAEECKETIIASGMS